MPMNPEIQIRIIDLAWEWVTKTERPIISSAEVMIRRLSKDFDQAYKAILSTVCPEPDKESGEEKK